MKLVSVERTTIGGITLFGTTIWAGGADLPVAVYHVRAVLEVLQTAVSPGEISNVLDRLPDDYLRLFAGSEGRMESV